MYQNDLIVFTVPLNLTKLNTGKDSHTVRPASAQQSNGFEENYGFSGEMKISHNF